MCLNGYCIMSFIASKYRELNATYCLSLFILLEVVQK